MINLKSFFLPCLCALIANLCTSVAIIWSNQARRFNQMDYLPDPKTIVISSITVIESFTGLLMELYLKEFFLHTQSLASGQVWHIPL